MPTTPRKKLIEVALPLEAINVASAREKSIRHGHPSTLHLWWARRPLAAARAVIFSSLVDDPDSPDALPAFVEACRNLPKGPNATANDTPRMRLFDFIEVLVKWESTTDEKVLKTARDLINIATEGNPPPLLDPFAGGGTIPLEAQRLGLEAHASDLNPVAVMINKAQIEIPPRFANQPPVNPRDRGQMSSGIGWKGAAGLAADVRYYGEWMREKARERIGHLYPKHNGETVIAWIWVRTVNSPNPAVNAHVPLTRSFELTRKRGHRTWVEPSFDADVKRVIYTVRREQDGADPRTIQDKTVSRQGARCVVSGVAIPLEYVRSEGRAGRMGTALMAIVTEGSNSRNYWDPSDQQLATSLSAQPVWQPQQELLFNPRYITPPNYGMNTFAALFTQRQLATLSTFSELIHEARKQAYQDALSTGLLADATPLRENGREAEAYSEAVSVYLSCAFSRLASYNNSNSVWNMLGGSVAQIFARQAISIVWDFIEINPLEKMSGNWLGGIDWVANALSRLNSTRPGNASQQDAQAVTSTHKLLVSTDPPYYDMIGYADLSDFFYVWMRRNLQQVFPELFGTMLVPKESELIANPLRHGGKESAKTYFEDGLHQTFARLIGLLNLQYPLTVYYAFKQLEADEDEAENNENSLSDIKSSTTSSSGWETMLNSLVEAGLNVTGTWPTRTERSGGLRNQNRNSLASSIVLVCRPRPANAPTTSRRQFVDALRRELPEALKNMQSGNIAPVDLAQASIGPGMAIYSRYSKVLEADGSALTVRAALGLINQELDAYLAEQDGSIDPDTRFAVAWFEQFSFNEGEFGHADVLARAKNTSVAGVEAAGLVVAGRGKVRLRHWTEVDPGAWDPKADRRPTVWEAVHHLIERLNAHGESGAAGLLLKMNAEMAAEARALAYRLYSICERKGWAEHALEYNKLVVSWTGVADQAAADRVAGDRGDRSKQQELL